MLIQHSHSEEKFKLQILKSLKSVNSILGRGVVVPRRHRGGRLNGRCAFARCELAGS